MTWKFVIIGPNNNNPDSKVYGANMRPTWGRQDPGGPHVGAVNFVIWEFSIGSGTGLA